MTDEWPSKNGNNVQHFRDFFLSRSSQLMMREAGNVTDLFDVGSSLLSRLPKI
jgi:hypothetical protein